MVPPKFCGGTRWQHEAMEKDKANKPKQISCCKKAWETYNPIANFAQKPQYDESNGVAIDFPEVGQKDSKGNFKVVNINRYQWIHHQELDQEPGNITNVAQNPLTNVEWYMFLTPSFLRLRPGTGGGGGSSTSQYFYRRICQDRQLMCENHATAYGQNTSPALVYDGTDVIIGYSKNGPQFSNGHAPIFHTDEWVAVNQIYSVIGTYMDFDSEYTVGNIVVDISYTLKLWYTYQWVDQMTFFRLQNKQIVRTYSGNSTTGVNTPITNSFKVVARQELGTGDLLNCIDYL